MCLFFKKIRHLETAMCLFIRACISCTIYRLDRQVVGFAQIKVYNQDSMKCMNGEHARA